MTRLASSGMLEIGSARLEYRMIGPQPDESATIVMLHEGLGSVAQWGTFPDDLARATGAGVFVYSRGHQGRGIRMAHLLVRLPRSVDVDVLLEDRVPAG